MKWRARVYYRDPANDQIYDHNILVDYKKILRLLKEIDSSILDHMEFVELKPIDDWKQHV